MSNLEVLNEHFIPQEFQANLMDETGWIDKKLITIKLLAHTSLKEKKLEYCEEGNISEQ